MSVGEWEAAYAHGEYIEHEGKLTIRGLVSLVSSDLTLLRNTASFLSCFCDHKMMFMLHLWRKVFVR